MSASSRILIFDLDGTLIDSMGPYTELFCEMLARECGVPDSISRDVYTQLLGKGPKAQFAAVLRKVESPDEALVEDMTRRYWLQAETEIPMVFPEVPEVLQTLETDGHTLIVSSGSIPSSALRKAQVTGIEPFFRLVLGSDEDVPELAKGPGHFAMITDALALPPGELAARGVFVGDGVYDMLVAREADILAIGRTTDGNGDVLLAAGADHLVEDLRDLPALLRVL